MSKRSFRRSDPRAPEYPSVDGLGRAARLGIAAAGAFVLAGTAACGAAPMPDLVDKTDAGEVDGGDDVYLGEAPAPDAGFYDGGEEVLPGEAPLPDAGS